MAETKRSFEQDDLFNRKPYAEFLKKLILNSDSYHRDDDVQAYTIAIDSPWGTGKSVFLEMFENMLETECQEQVRIVHYNAWKNDFWNNAFEPFADAIFTSEWFCNALQDDVNEQSAKKFLGAAKNVMLSFVKKKMEDNCDAELLEKAIEDFAKGLKVATTNNVSFLSKSYLDYVASLKQMQDAMDDVLANTLPGGKLVIVIDELDRCRPTFAIETLEIVKHIMDVQNVVYIFALDVRQLGAAIKQIYGSDTDATGYLMRLFSYYSRMPEPLNRNMIKLVAENLFNNIADVREEADEKERMKQNRKFLDNMTSVSEALELSARDLETIGKVYDMMKKSFLIAYQNSRAYLLYWFLLCAKYKNPILFDSWLKGNITYPFSEQRIDIWPDRIIDAVQEINDKECIGERDFSVHENSEEDNEQDEVTYIVDGDEAVTEEIRLYIRSDIHGKLLIYDSPYPTMDDQPYHLDVKGDVSGVLFYGDLIHWADISRLTLKQYFAKRMEMFEFLPASENR